MSNHSKLVSITFKDNKKPYTFKTNIETLKINDSVVVETTTGLELGKCVSEPKDINVDNQFKEYKSVIRKATPQDEMMHIRSQKQALIDRKIVEQAILDEKLPMNVIACEYTLDQGKLVITYLSEKRVDFRNLLKTLTSQLPCRIELRQVGPREKAKMVGGLGVCGQKLCCKETKKDFDMVTISMAKNQMLTLNINKLSGQCGKLKCCLRFENDYYTDEKQGLPQLHSKIEYQGHQYRVAEFNVISHTITLTKPQEVRVITFDDYRDYVKEA